MPQAGSFPAPDPNGYSPTLDIQPRDFDVNLDLMEALLTDGVAGFAYVDLDFRFIRLNQVLAGIYGMRADDLLGKPVRDMVGDVNWDKVKPCLVAASSGATVLGVHACEDRPDSEGIVRHRVSSFYPIRFDHEVVGIAAVVHDVTERAMAEQAVRDSEARYRLLAETIPHLVWIIDGYGRFLYMNRRMIEYAGANMEEINRNGWLSYVAPDEQAQAAATWMGVQDAGVTFEVEYRLRRHDGQYRWFLVRGVPMSDEKGSHMRWLGTCTDIDDHKKAEQASVFLDELSERMRALSNPDAILDEVVTSLGKYFKASRCGYALNDWGTQTLTVRQEYCAPDCEAVSGTYPRASFPRQTSELLAAGQVVVIADSEVDPRISDSLDFYRFIKIRSAIIVPIIRNGVYEANLSVIMEKTPRVWRKDEVELVRNLAERTWLALDNARLHRERELADAKQRTVIRDILSVVTDGRLHVCDGPGDLPRTLPLCSETIALNEGDGIRRLRHQVRELAEAMGFDEIRSSDLMTAASEAAMNAVVHAGGGEGWIAADDRAIQVWIVDRGGGILMENLPHATLVRGYSTASTLGHGFKMIIGSTDHVHLLTGETGTTVVIEHLLHPPEPAW